MVQGATLYKFLFASFSLLAYPLKFDIIQTSGPLPLLIGKCTGTSYWFSGFNDLNMYISGLNFSRIIYSTLEESLFGNFCLSEAFSQSMVTTGPHTHTYTPHTHTQSTLTLPSAVILPTMLEKRTYNSPLLYFSPHFLI